MTKLSLLRMENSNLATCIALVIILILSTGCAAQRANSWKSAPTERATAPVPNSEGVYPQAAQRNETQDHKTGQSDEPHPVVKGAANTVKVVLAGVLLVTVVLAGLIITAL